MRTTDSRHAYPNAPNRLGQRFAADRPNRVWLADLTYVPTGEGGLFLAAIIDMTGAVGVDDLDVLQCSPVLARTAFWPTMICHVLGISPSGYYAGEGFYNPRRLHSAFGYRLPAEAERTAA